jgi:catechol 2,3-dioxygenase-like lactoylglutathione lyase family enzyme
MLSTLATDVEIQAITITVSNLESSRQFYEELLGFELKRFYQPTRWVAYKNRGGALFAVLESTHSIQPLLDAEVIFYSDEIEQLWEKLREKVSVKEPLQTTLWGATQFIIYDPDGYQLVFVKTPVN